MRCIFIFIIIIFAASLQAQTTLPVSFQNNIHDSIAKKKWFITSYGGITTGYSFFNRGNSAFIAAPFSVQLNRRLNNNLYAFAGVTAAPVYGNFNHAFLTTDLNKVNTFNSFYQPANLSMYSAATLGLMYINDAKTFSVSGSISVERSSYPVFYNNQFNTKRTNNSIIPSR